MKRFAIATATLALAVVPAATALAKTRSHAVRHTRTTRPAGESGRPVIDWNQTLVCVSTTRPACGSVTTSPATCSATRCCPPAPSRGDDPLRA